MAKLLSLFSIFAFVVAISIVGTQADNCDDNLQKLVKECKEFVMNPDDPKTPPSGGCCAVVQQADVPCLCSKVTPEIERIVSMAKVVFVATKCNRPLQPGSNCGSYKIPGN